MEYAVINWLDAQKHPEIPAMHAAKIAPIEAITVGVVMEKNDNYITIAQTIFEETETSPLPNPTLDKYTQALGKRVSNTFLNLTERHWIEPPFRPHTERTRRSSAGPSIIEGSEETCAGKQFARRRYG